MIEVRAKLTVKELSGVNGWTVSYLYKARMAGLPMERDEETRCLVATPESVETWIRKNKFKVVDGVPKVEQQRRKGTKL